MKTKRQEVILKIIKDNEIDTQEALQDKLRELGFDVTQATVSRDINSLDLVKLATKDGKYCYSQKSDDLVRKKKIKFQSVFMEAVISADFAQNIVAVKCHVGMGNAACAALDIMHLDDVVGTIAGDDTIFVLLKTTQQAQEFVEKIYDMIGR